MKIKTLMLVTFLAAPLVGCGVLTKKTSTPVVSPTGQIVGTNTTYVAAPAIQKYTQDAQAALAQISPYVPPPYQSAVTATNVVIGGIGAALTAIASLIAQRQNKKAADAQASSDQHEAAAQAMAQTINNVAVSNPAILSTAATIAAANGSSGTVAEHLADTAKPI